MKIYPLNTIRHITLCLLLLGLAEPLLASQSTADHSQFEQLDEEFDYAPDVTETCLECHTEAAKQIHQTQHWTWAAKIDGKLVGKSQNAFNNYCVAARGNSSCTQCHAYEKRIQVVNPFGTGFERCILT